MTTRRRARSTEESTSSSSDDSEDDLESTAESVEDRNTTRRQHRIPVVVLSIVVTVTVIVIVLTSTTNVGKSYWHPTFRNTLASSTKRQRFQEQRQKEIIRPYQLWTSEDIYERLHEWTEQFPRLVELTSAQEAYNLPGAGTDADCPFEEDAPGCKTWILTIKDKSQPADEQRHSMPQVLLSGALHGDEVVGPTTVMETANLLLEAARCEALPQGHAWNGTDYVELTKEQIQRELDAARECRVNLAQRGIFPLHRKWLARLVTTRTIIVVPTANALGYFRRTREEVDIDPNRDFPFDRKDDKDCLQSIAGRSLYQLFIQRIVQMTITFHGGMEAVAYEWGAPSRTGVAPDAVSQEQISNLYSRFAGALDGGENYPTGTMNELVYPVEGGLEDWSYAASWDKELVQTLCTPTKNGGYDSSLQPPTNSYSLRMFTVLVETSNDKRPPDNTLGTNQDAFTPLGRGNGHISRNIRLALGMIDLVEPYVQVLAVNGLEIWDDIVPMSPRVIGSCEKTKVISVPFGTTSASLSWTVGGALTVDHTSLWYGSATEFDSAPFRCGNKETTQDQVDEFLKGHAIRKTDPVYGKTHWHQSVAFPTPGEEALQPLETIFTTHIDLESFQEGDLVTVYAVARVDQEWSEQREAPLPPQTHIARVRTDPTWRAEDASGVVQGRLDWLSIPLTLEIGAKTSIMEDKSVRNPFDVWKGPGKAEEEPLLSAGSIYRALVAAIVASLVACSCVIFRDENDGTEVWSVWMNRGRGSTSDYDGGVHRPIPNDLELAPQRHTVIT